MTEYKIDFKYITLNHNKFIDLKAKGIHKVKCKNSGLPKATKYKATETHKQLANEANATMHRVFN